MFFCVRSRVSGWACLGSWLGAGQVDLTAAHWRFGQLIEFEGVVAEGDDQERCIGLARGPALL